MSRRSKVTDEERIEAVQEYLNGEGSYHSIAKKYGINYERFRQLVIRAQTEGIESVKIRHTQKKYTVETTDGEIVAKDIHALCLKDFNTSEKLQEMVEAGVYSFKIEGRLKEIGYVKNITAYYRQELDKISTKSSSGKCRYSFISNPEKSFNRCFTDYFMLIYLKPVFY